MCASPTVRIRHERPEDYRRTEELAREAFWNRYRPGALEHAIIHRLRTHPDFLPDLSFVLDIDGVVEGGIFTSRSRLITQGGIVPTVTFGPVFLAPARQGQGFGRMLITQVLRQARTQDFAAVLILGHPQHYRSYGFRGGKTCGISLSDGTFPVCLLALPLHEGALTRQGHVVFSPALEMQDRDADAFDAGFPFKEKHVLPCQRIFEELCAMTDT